MFQLDRSGIGVLTGGRPENHGDGSADGPLRLQAFRCVARSDSDDMDLGSSKRTGKFSRERTYHPTGSIAVHRPALLCCAVHRGWGARTRKVSFERQRHVRNGHHIIFSTS